MSQALRSGFPIFLFYQYNWNGSWEHSPSKLSLTQGQPMEYVTTVFFLFPQRRDIWGQSYQLSFLVYTSLSHGFFNFFFKPGFWTSVLLTFWAGCSLCWGHSVHYGKLRLSHRFLVILVLTHDSRCPCRLQLDTNVLNWLHYFLPLHVIFFLDELLLYRKSYQVIFHQNKTNNTKQKTPLLVSLIAEGQWSCWKRAIPMAGSADNCWEFICLVS